MGIKVGYARCSTDPQDLDANRRILLGLGVPAGRMYLDRAYSGTNRARPGLDRALAAVRPGDTLVVPKLDRLARSMPDVRQIGDSLVAHRVRLQLGTVVYDPADPMGKVFFDIVGTFAEFEAGLLRMRTREGMAVARAEGRLKGRAPKLSTARQAHLLTLRAAGKHTIAELADLFEVSRQTVYRVLERASPDGRVNDDHRVPAVPPATGDQATEARVRAVTDTGLDAVGDPVFDRIAGLVRILLGVPVALVSLFDARRQFFPGAAGLAEPWATGRQTPLSRALCQHVASAQGPLVVSDARHDARCSANPAVTELGIVGYVGMPLTDADGTVLGALCAIDHTPRQWTEAELSLLADAALACSDSLRLRIVTTHAEAGRVAAGEASRRARAATDRSELLLTASVLLAEARTVTQIVAAVAQLTSPAFAPAHVGMVLLDAEQRLQVLGAGRLPSDVAARWVSFPTSAPLPAAVAFRTGQLLSLGDPASIRADFPQLADDVAALGWQAIACAPVPGVRGPLGVLTFSWRHPHHLDADQRSVMVTVAGYVGQALQRVTHLEQQNTAARTLQQALLTRLPRTGEVRLAARYLPAHHGDLVGGDWYDAVSLPDGRLALVIGDVSGHNLTAAAAMSELRSMLRGFLIDRVETPSAMLDRLDHANNALGASTIATVLVAYLDHELDGSHTLRWCNAGHPAPTVLSPDGHVTTLPGTDPLLGARHRRPRTTHHHRLPPGATMLLHTDGLVETRDAVIDDGFDRLHQLLAGHRDPDPETLADLLVTHADARTREDDVALILAAIAPVSTPTRRTTPRHRGASRP